MSSSRTSTLLVVLVIIPILSGSGFMSAIRAQVYNSIWDGASGLLPDQSCAPWQHFGSIPSSLSAGIMTVSTSNTSCATHDAYEQSGSALSNPLPNPWIIEMRVRFVSGGTCGGCGPYRRAISVQITTAPSVGIQFMIGQDEIFLTTACSSKTAAIVDTTSEFHTYRIEVNTTSGFVTVLYDGAVTLMGNTYSNSNDNGPVPLIVWGDGSSAAYGTSEWEFVRHNAYASGCFAGAPQPGLVGRLLLTDKTTLSWPQSCGDANYDVVKGDLMQLRSIGGDFTSSLSSCLVNDATMPTASDPEDPTSGRGFYYLVRYADPCLQNGSYDEGGSPQSQSNPRDAGINASLNACP